MVNTDVLMTFEFMLLRRDVDSHNERVRQMSDARDQHAPDKDRNRRDADPLHRKPAVYARVG
jgi:hypothetical protein